MRRLLTMHCFQQSSWFFWEFSRISHLNNWEAAKRSLGFDSSSSSLSCLSIFECRVPELGKKVGCKAWEERSCRLVELPCFWISVVYICSKMLKKEYLIIYHNYYNSPVAGPCLQTPNWGLKTRQQISSSSWLQEVSRSQAVPPCWCLVAPQPGSRFLQSSSCILVRALASLTNLWK